MGGKQRFNGEKIIIWDAEYTSWKDCNKKGWDPNKNQYMEIVQISAILVNSKNYKIEKEFNGFIKPNINPKLSGYFKKLTKISQDKIANAKSFEEVLKKFIKFIKNYQCYSYGNDFSILKENTRLNKTRLKPNKNQFQDIKQIFKDGGVPVEKFHSGNILDWFEVKHKNEEHNALSDSKSLLEGLKLLDEKLKSK